MSATVLDPTQSPSNQVNILDNGGFEIWQRGTSFAGLSTNNVYTADRWETDMSGGAVMTISQNSANVDSGSFSLDMNITTVGTASASIKQLIENYLAYAGKTVTCSVRVKTSLTGFHIELFDGIGGVTAGNNHSGSGNFETLTCTRTISASATSLRIYIGWPSQPPSGTGHSYVDSAILTVGTGTPVFQVLHPEVDLERCQRYYQLGNLDHWSPIWRQDASNQGTNTTVPFRVSMRVAPTVTFTNKFALLRHLPTTGSGSSVDSTNWTVSAASISTSEFLDAWARTSDQTTWELVDVSANWTASADM